jgi:hypothetical protein
MDMLNRFLDVNKTKHLTDKQLITSLKEKQIKYNSADRLGNGDERRGFYYGVVFKTPNIEMYKPIVYVEDVQKQLSDANKQHEETKRQLAEANKRIKELEEKLASQPKDNAPEGIFAQANSENITINVVEVKPIEEKQIKVMPPKRIIKKIIKQKQTPPPIQVDNIDIQFNEIYKQDEMIDNTLMKLF